MSLTTFMVFLDNTVVNTALPSISRDLNASTATLQWVIDGYTLVLAGLLLLGGPIGDRSGRRFLTMGMVIFGLGAVGAARAGSAETLILMRGVQGVGASSVSPGLISTTGMAQQWMDDANVQPPRLMGAVSAEQVARGVLRAIKDDTTEVLWDRAAPSC